MTVKQIIDEIEAMSPEEQLEVVRFAYKLDAERKLTGIELSALAEKLIGTKDPAEALQVRSEIVRGFYGTAPDA